MNTATPSEATSIIASALQMQIDGVRPEGRNYLIVSSGHAYLQFSYDWRDGAMLTEAVSNISLKTGS